MKKKIICIVGESCSGKDTLVNLMKEISSTDGPDGISIVPVVSYATRPKRENETNGIEHIFVSDERAKEILDTEQIVAYTKIENKEISNSKGYEYFTTMNEIKNSNIYIIDPKGIEYIKNNKELIKELEIVSIYIYTPKLIRNLRARKRSDYKTSYKKRVLNERIQFKEFYKKKKYDYKINNLFGSQYLNAYNLYNICKKELKGK